MSLNVGFLELPVHVDKTVPSVQVFDPLVVLLIHDQNIPQARRETLREASHGLLPLHL